MPGPASGGTQVPRPGAPWYCVWRDGSLLAGDTALRTHAVTQASSAAQRPLPQPPRSPCPSWGPGSHSRSETGLGQPQCGGLCSRQRGSTGWGRDSKREGRKGRDSRGHWVQPCLRAILSAASALVCVWGWRGSWHWGRQHCLHPPTPPRPSELLPGVLGDLGPFL